MKPHIIIPVAVLYNIYPPMEDKQQMITFKVTGAKLSASEVLSEVLRPC